MDEGVQGKGGTSSLGTCRIGVCYKEMVISNHRSRDGKI